jgi:hypothetical protein
MKDIVVILLIFIIGLIIGYFINDTMKETFNNKCGGVCKSNMDCSYGMTCKNGKCCI